MNKIDLAIKSIDEVICKNIDLLYTDRGVLSQNILSQIRNLIEHIALKVYSCGQDTEINYENLCKGIEHIKTLGKLSFLNKFHQLVQISVSHYTPNEENSERLMLKYYEYLIRIKNYLQKTYNFEVLSNINKFPIDTDSATIEYYTKIVEKIDNFRGQDLQIDRYYIQKTKPFFINGEIYYEITFNRANDSTSKFDRIIAFTKLDISDNYSVRLYTGNEYINILDKKMPIRIIYNREVSVRPCEINNFSRIFGKNLKIKSDSVEYRNLMDILTRSGLSLTEIVSFSDNYYQRVKNRMLESKSNHIITILDECRKFINQRLSGYNTIKYLLYRLNNKVIKQQCCDERCNKLSNLFLKFGCIPFEEMPFNTSLINHNPRLSDLFHSIDPSDREYEVLARFIKNNTEVDGKLYTPLDDIVESKDISNLIQKYNNKLYRKHSSRKLEIYNGHIYIHCYENDTVEIVKMLKQLSTVGLKNYSNSVDSWLQSPSCVIDCESKKSFLKELFETSSVAIIYGAAGTGKSTMINHVAHFFGNKKKFFLANTNPAVENLKRRVDTPNCTFKTIAKFLSYSNNDKECDLLIIDECSTVSNDDILKVLNKASFKLLVLVGDPFQIESIQFGNWFNIVQEFIPKTSIFELTKPYRSTNEKLLDLWKRVRNMEDSILEHISKNAYSLRLDESIFQQTDDDQIILCLNYDGLYGINNINRFLQSNNPNAAVRWGVQVYKVGDPIIFNDTERFGQSIYNNLKGKIVNIQISNEQIQFDIEINEALNELDAKDFELLDGGKKGSSIIRFSVNKAKNTDDDDESSDTVVPFQVAYAVSIHKSQGLEFKSVKIVITNEVEERITHNIFYTAITRAKEYLKIYRSPETENKILQSLERKNNRKDINLLKQKFNL